MLPRADVRDRLIGAPSIAALRHGAVVGTSSPRRAAEIKRLRPDLETVSIRGNVDTRLAKQARGEVDATLLAAAGLDRLGRGDVGSPIPIDQMLPAPGQGAIGIECRSDDAKTSSLLGGINHRETWEAVQAERAFALALGGTCHSPVGAFADIDGGQVRLRCQLLSEDGRDCLAEEIRFPVGDPLRPAGLAHDMLARAPASIRKLFEANG
jgi:hydroxymethylbilane synthase